MDHPSTALPNQARASSDSPLCRRPAIARTYGDPFRGSSLAIQKVAAALWRLTIPLEMLQFQSGFIECCLFLWTCLNMFEPVACPCYNFNTKISGYSNHPYAAGTWDVKVPHFLRRNMAKPKRVPPSIWFALELWNIAVRCSAFPNIGTVQRQKASKWCRQMRKSAHSGSNLLACSHLAS